MISAYVKCVNQVNHVGHQDVNARDCTFNYTKSNFDWEILGFRHGDFEVFWDVRLRNVIEEEKRQNSYYAAAKCLLNIEV